jgi:hypothetical protein
MRKLSGRPFHLILPFILIVFLVPLYLFGEGKRDEIGSLKELIDRYDSSRCKECHGEIYAQWEKSHHARSLMGMDGWIFMSKYLKEGVFSVQSPGQATKANFPCAKCHLPQLFQAADSVAAELAAAVLRDDKKTINRLNISCLVCHQEKAVVHGRPRTSALYGSREIKDHEGLPVKKSPLLKDPLFCGQCHGLGPNLEFEHPVQCATLYGSYLHAYLPSGGSRTCQECHMPGKDHTTPPNFNDRADTAARFREALPLEVETLGYVFQIEEGKHQPQIVVKTRITSKAGHRIPDG